MGEMRAERCWWKAACLVDHGGDLSSYSEQGESPEKVLSRGWTGCELGSNKTPLAECGEWIGVGAGAGQKPGDQGLLQQSRGLDCGGGREDSGNSFGRQSTCPSWGPTMCEPCAGTMATEMLNAETLLTVQKHQAGRCNFCGIGAQRESRVPALYQALSTEFPRSNPTL